MTDKLRASKKKAQAKKRAANKFQKQYGAPTLFNEAIISKAYKYIEECVDEYDAYITGSSKGKAGTRESLTLKLRANLPTAQGLALYLEVIPSTVYDWAERHPEFAYTLEVLKATQRQQLTLMALSGSYNSNIVTLLLGHNHGLKNMSEMDTKQEIHITLTEQDMRL